MKRLIVCLLLLAILAFALVSCGKKKPAATEEPTAATGTTDKWEALSPEVRAFPSDTRTLRIELSDFENAEKDSKNDLYVAGPDENALSGADTIGKMVYERNSNAKRLLGTTVEYSYWDYAWESQGPKIVEVVQGADPSMPDLFVNMIYDLGNATLQGVLKDVWSIPGSYFDFEADGWMDEWMKSMSLTGDRAYILAGDYFIDIVRAFGVLPFNADLMDANGAKLAPALLGGGLGAGETMSQRFFDYVEAGNWTWDALGKLCAAVWVDNGTPGQTDIYDTLGMLGNAQTGMTTSFYLYSANEPLFETRTIKDENDPNNGKTWIYYAEDSTVLGGIFDAVANVFKGDGALATNASADNGATAENPSTAYHWVKFGQGETLFAGACAMGAIELDAFQEMRDLFSVVPLPKVSADKKYNTIIHNIGDAGAINVKTEPGKTKVLSAYLQYCTEHSTAIRTHFQEVVVKYKNTVYNQGTDRMLDLIYNSVVNGRDKSIEDLMRGDATCKGLQWHNFMKKEGKLDHTSAYIASDYKSARDTKQAYLDSILETWYNLPTSK